jgi:signal transduction histidine kinase
MAADTVAAQDVQQQIRAEQIEILYRHIPLSQATNLLVATLLTWFLWKNIPHETLLGWWSGIVGVVLLRVVMLIAYRRRRPDSRIRWHTLMTAATTLSGILWGAAGILFFLADSTATLVFLTIILAGMSAGTIASHSSWPPAQLSYAILTMMPISLRYLAEDSDLWVLGPMCMIYFFNILVFSRQTSRTLIESIRLRLEKQKLVLQLRDEMAAAEQARQRAEDANLAKSKFLAAASHDLRQPLHAVNLFIEALRNEKDPSRAETVLASLGASAQALEELLNELLDISKLEAGLFKPQTRVVALQEIFAALERELQPVAEENGIELGFVATHLKIESDPNMLGRILRNIITNAIRYTDKGAVLVGCRRKGGRVAITVCDTGPGIAPEHHRAIFREFYQLGNPARDRRKGLGLGLAIVDGLCRILDHPLELKSKLGHGTTFQVQVPIAVDTATYREEIPAETSLGLHGYAVLVIDDEPAICQAMAEVLERWGCQALTARNAQDALTQLSASGFCPDVIIADYRLEDGRTGTEAIAAVRDQLGHPVPAAILTGDTAPERLREASASGFLLLHKPVNPARLRAALFNWRTELTGA